MHCIVQGVPTNRVSCSELIGALAESGMMTEVQQVLGWPDIGWCESWCTGDREC